MLDEVRTPRLVIAGTASNVGKTILTAGLIAAFKARGLTVQSFKVGPDYIDPAYLAHVSGRPCRNLDSWMLGEGALRQVLAQGALGADLALIEGMLGLFDGRGGSPDGSTADVARIVKAPVVLVVDVADMAQSAAAVALGFKSYGEPPKIAGVLLNNVRSDAHRRSVEDAIWDIAKLPVLGALPKMAQLDIPQRQRGLLPLDAAGIDLGGAFPESFVAPLARNRAIAESIQRAYRGGVPIYAECGGLMYLGRSLRTSGATYEMADVIPVDVEMDGEIHRFGYRQILTLEDSILSSRGQFYRGHEFHWSRITGHDSGLKSAYQMLSAEGDVIGYEGFVGPNLLASYIHLHFGQNPVLVDKFVQHCREYATVRTPF